MLKATSIIAAAFALSAQAAMAGPLGASMTASETGAKAAKSERSVVSSVMAQLKFSMSAIRGTVGHSSGESTEYKSSPNEQCEEAKKATDEDDEAHKAKKAEPVGPEPIYFGF